MTTHAVAWLLAAWVCVRRAARVWEEEKRKPASRPVHTCTCRLITAYEH